MSEMERKKPELATLPEREKANKPEIEMNENAREIFERLVEQLRSKEGKKICVVVRCWNKSAEDLQGLRDRIEKLKQHIPEIAGVFVSINKKGENGTTPQAALEIGDDDLPFVPVEVDNYSWTAGLNAPASLLSHQEDLLHADIDIFNLSFDSEFSDDDIKTLAHRIHSNKPVVMRREQSSKERDEEGNLRSDSEVAKQIRELLRKGPTTTEDFAGFLETWHKDLLSLGRNTASIYNVKDITRLGGFNPACNEWGGMEDHEFGSRLLLDFAYRLRTADGEEKEQILAHIRGWLRAMAEPVYFSDPQWNSREKKDRDFKYNHETKAFEMITRELHSKLQQNTTDPQPDVWIIPKDKQDFLL